MLDKYAEQRILRYLRVREKHGFDGINHTRSIYFDLRQALRKNMSYLDRFPADIQHDFLEYNSCVDNHRSHVKGLTVRDLPRLDNIIDNLGPLLDDIVPSLQKLVVSTILSENKRGLYPLHIERQRYMDHGPIFLRLKEEFPKWEDCLSCGERVIVDAFTDPVLLDIPHRAVIASDGHIYEKVVAETILRTTGRSPLTREVLDRKTYPVHRIIEKFFCVIYERCKSTTTS